jgi:anti-sigma B factor antagonist
MAEQGQPQTSHITVRDTGDVKIVVFTDRKILEELSIHELGDELSRLVDSEPGIKLLVSFKNVEHLSSAALGMLIKLNKQVCDARGQLKLADITPPIFEVFKITRLNKLFDIHETAERALANFQ